MLNLNLLETFSIPLELSDIHTIKISETGHFAISAAGYILVYQMLANKENNSSSLSLKKFIIQSPKYTLSSNLGLRIKSFVFELPREELYDSILNVGILSNVGDASSLVSKFTKIAWSPPRLDTNKDCVLAALTNTGVVYVFTKVYDFGYHADYILSCNVTQKYIDIVKKNWDRVQEITPSEQYKKVIERISQIKATAFAWSAIISNSYCFLMLAHANGKISFWKVKPSSKNEQLSVEFVREYDTDMNNITTIAWKRFNIAVVILLSNRDGKSETLKITKATESEIVIEPAFALCDIEYDHVISFHTMKVRNKDILVLVKRYSLMFIGYDELRRTKSCYEYDVEGVVIGAEVFDEFVLVLTAENTVRELTVSIDDSSPLDIKCRNVNVDINYTLKRIIGMIRSRNNVFYGFLAVDIQPYIRNMKRDYDMFIFWDKDRNPLQALLDNPSRALTYHWDCLEVMRYLAIRDKFIDLDIIPTENHYDLHDTYTLNIISWATKLCETIAEGATKTLREMKPSRDVETLISLKAALTRMEHLVNQHERNKDLTSFQRENVRVLIDFFKQFTKTDTADRLDLSTSLTSRILDLWGRVTTLDFNSETALPKCNGCDDDLVGLECMPPHYVSRCVISMMRVAALSTFKCVSCNGVGHEEIANEVDIVVCPRCDVPMSKRTICSE